MAIPLVSVIIPVYNFEHFLRESLDSIIGQSYEQLEIIIIDDCSKDDSWKIINEYASIDRRIVPIRNPQNLNSAATRNIGILRASGEYICLHDSDDVSEKDRIRKQVEVLQNCPRLGAVGSFVTIIDEKSEKVGVRNYPTTHHDIIKTMTLYCPIAQPTMMIRKSVFNTVGLYNEKFSRAQDYDLWFRILQNYEINILKERLVRYRRHADQGLNTRLRENYVFTLELQRKYMFNKMFFSLKSTIIYPFKYLLKFLPLSILNKILNLAFYTRMDG